MMDCLVLDKNWKPVSFTGWQNAIKLWYEGVAEIIKEDEDKRVHSQYFDKGVPRVIVVKNAWVKRLKKQDLPCSRRNVFIRDNGACQYCGMKLTTWNYTLDHVFPQCLGGKDTWENLVVACQECNWKKAGKTLQQSGMHLRRIPVKPKNNDSKFTFRLRINKLRPEWKEWESWIYWNIELEG
jgi:5-methylcytosine-specific restriction endonuclease McrA